MERSSLAGAASCRHEHAPRWVVNMNPSKVERNRTRRLTDLPNVGPVVARNLESIGVNTPSDLEGRDPFEMYELRCERKKVRSDPCLLDTFMSITDYISGNEPRLWWAYTEERKRRYGRALILGRKT